MRRATPRQLGSVCQLCSTTPATTLGAGARRVSSRLDFPRQAASIRLSGARWMASAASPSNNTAASAVPARIVAPVVPATKGTRPIANPAQLASKAEQGLKAFVTAVRDGPNKQAAKSALESCLQYASTLHPQLRRANSAAKASASRLAMLGGERSGTTFDVDTDLGVASSKISQAAYSVISHPNVEMTPDMLELYVHTQAQLGRAETLPAVLEMYAHKAKPVVKDGGVVQYVAQNPDAAAKAVEKDVADLALQTAIDAKNLDAALGITEAAFCTKAFKRQKLIKRGTAPAMTLAAVPFGVLGLGTIYATHWQNTMDLTTATAIGVAGISGYVFVTGSLGIIAKLSHKSQMKRVTWLPGTPLRYRWMREEEREALDKIACAWGFKESWRHGEETGPEWEGLREYMGYRQMLREQSDGATEAIPDEQRPGPARGFRYVDGQAVVGLSWEDQTFYEAFSNDRRRKLRRKTDYRLLPTLCILYLCAQLDRGNIGNAKIEGLQKDTNMTGLHQWYPREHVAFRMSLFMAFAAASGTFSAGLRLAVPSIIKGLGFTKTRSQLIGSIPYISGVISSLLVTFVSGRTAKKWHIVAGCWGCIAMGFTIAIIVVNVAQNKAPGVVAGMSFVTSGVFPMAPISGSWASMNLGDSTRRAIGIGFIMGLGSLGGVTGSFIYRDSDSPYFHLGYGLSLGLAIVGLVITTVLALSYSVTNRKKRRTLESGIRGKHTEGGPAAVGTESPLFLYTL
ncbi:hypothetical protein GMORB2_6098 [Geosmithia morbida]|uniref:Uncharacterized protein n=1 Tax=Geosmithia morbida TaxID=1094350 RepID=A0A9P4YX33_9HYPO|nr:uncharacterized protein GMORB2_6098 [Geosmithia morbida]KAF4123397.1 hypothetical protein GMORB2_6098 [Geosmithia morbida]